MRQGCFALVSCETQLDEFRAVLARPFFREQVKRSEAGRMVDTTRRLALMYDLPPALEVSTDPSDDYLLSLARVSGADYLVTGDKSHLLPLDRHDATGIVTARELIQRLGHGRIPGLVLASWSEED